MKLLVLLLLSNILWASELSFKGQFKCDGLLDDGDSIKMEVSLNKTGKLAWKKYDIEFHTYKNGLSFYHLNGFTRINPDFHGPQQYLKTHNMKAKVAGNNYFINIKDYASQLTPLLKFGLIADINIKMEFLKSGNTLKIDVESTEGKKKSKSNAMFFCNKISSTPKFSDF